MSLVQDASIPLRLVCAATVDIRIPAFAVAMQVMPPRNISVLAWGHGGVPLRDGQYVIANGVEIFSITNMEPGVVDFRVSFERDDSLLTDPVEVVRGFALQQGYTWSQKNPGEDHYAVETPFGHEEGPLAKVARFLYEGGLRGSDLIMRREASDEAPRPARIYCYHCGGRLDRIGPRDCPICSRIQSP